MFPSIPTTALAALAALSAPVTAFWRMPCPQHLIIERIDPLVSPGNVSGHVHTVSGGNGAGYITSYDDLRASTCSSCPIKQDLSIYWTPQLYYMNEAGNNFEQIPQLGGMTVYYLQRGSDTNRKAFPPGFRMLAGDPFQRNATGAEAAPGNAVSFVCLDYYNVNHPPVPQGTFMPNANCPDGLRAQVFFPSCWDGVNLDSEDHHSHMAYPTGAGTYDNGKCPESHPVQMISIFYEVIYQTNLWSDRWWSSKHPFVFAMGDRTGYGFHGDFINGWNETYLQHAVDTCTASSGTLEDCHVFDTDGVTGESGYFDDSVSNNCQIPTQINEAINSTSTSPLTKLPGCNKVTDGPAYAPPPASCSDTPAVGNYIEDFTNVLNLGWAYQGCAEDEYNSRTFKGASTSGDDMTVSYCVNYCKSKGFSLAGLEWSRECYCDNDYSDSSRAPNDTSLGDCDMNCAGNANAVCGGSEALSVYKHCNGGSCQNVAFKSPSASLSKSVTDLIGSSGTSSSSGEQSRRKRHTHAFKDLFGRSHKFTV